MRNDDFNFLLSIIRSIISKIKTNVIFLFYWKPVAHHSNVIKSRVMLFFWCIPSERIKSPFCSRWRHSQHSNHFHIDTMRPFVRPFISSYCLPPTFILLFRYRQTEALASISIDLILNVSDVILRLCVLCAHLTRRLLAG